MSELMIEQRTTTADEQHACQQWSLWESDNIEEFNYDYDQDVEFIVQQGAAIIRTTSGEEIAILAGKRVIIRAGVSACWEITAPIVNRYRYL